MDEYKHQLNFKIFNHLYNFRAKTNEELADFLGFTDKKPSADMILFEIARLNSKIEDIYKKRG